MLLLNLELELVTVNLLSSNISKYEYSNDVFVN